MGKIVNALKWMRISVLKLVEEPNIKTIQDFQIVWGVLRAEKQWLWGLQIYPRQEEHVPSYRATRNEKILLVLAPV
jgi:hypothetical protein